VIVVLASRFDESARDGLAAWGSAGDRALMTPHDLTLPGWTVQAERPADGTIVIGGQIMSARRVTGLVNLLPHIGEFELLRIRKADRPYVVAELSAFLTWWLGAVPFPVFNRPTPGSLSGPAWRFEQGEAACHRTGIPVERSIPDERKPDRAGPAAAEEIATTTVVRGRCHGTRFPEECTVLASLTGAAFLQGHFVKRRGRWVFSGVNLFPPITQPFIRDILIAAVEDDPKGAEHGIGVGHSGR
jgi:hypothetical protein